MLKILIIGKNSYIGQSFQKYLSRLSTEDFDVSCISFRDDGWRDMNFSCFDTVLNFTSIVPSGIKTCDREEYFKVNCQLACDLARKARYDGARQYVYMSSLAVFGLEGTFDADYNITAATPELPTTIYGESKLAAEEGLLRLRGAGFDVTILRVPMVYGFNCPGNYRKLREITLATPIFPKVDNQRSVIYIENLCRYIEKMAELPQSGIFYPDNKLPVNTSSLVSEIGKNHKKDVYLIRGLEHTIHWIGKRSSSIRKLFGSLVIGDDLKLNTPSGYDPISFEETIKEAEHGPWPDGAAL